MADNKQKATEFKDKGNKALAEGNHEEAIRNYTRAIELDPTNYIFFSNRSAAYANLKQFENSLNDANKTVELNPRWAKGYSRKGLAHFFLSQYEAAVQAYKKGLELEPDNPQLKQGLADVQRELEQKAAPSMGQLFGEIFNGDIFTKLRMNPVTAPYLSDPSFVSTLSEIQRDPSKLASHLQDQRFMNVLSVLIGQSPKYSEPEVPSPKKEAPKPKPEDEKKKKEELEKKQKEEEQSHLTEEQREALKEKEKGNEAYKNKDFPTALAHYSKAIEFDPNNIVYLTNRAAVYSEMQDYENCIADCNKAIEVGRSVYADYKLIAKAFQRIGNAYMKQEKYAEAVKAFNSSLTEHRTPEVLKAKQRAEKLKAEKDVKDYIDVGKSQEEKNKGNDFFKQAKYPEAIQCYTEAIRRNPEDHTLYSNRAACYTKLGEYPTGLKDCEKAVELCPTFVRAYSRKGLIHFLMKEYHKALECYDKGLKLDPSNEECREGINKTMAAVDSLQQEGNDKEAVEKAMRDPEIHEILADPVMRQVLADMSSDPKAAQVHLKNPAILAKLQKLVAAGIVQMKTA